MTGWSSVCPMTSMTLFVRAELIEKHAVGAVLLRFDALDDPVFDIVEGNAVGGRFFPSAALGASGCQRHLAGRGYHRRISNV